VGGGVQGAEESRGTEDDDENEAQLEGEAGLGARLICLVILTGELKRKEKGETSEGKQRD